MCNLFNVSGSNEQSDAHRRLSAATAEIELAPDASSSVTLTGTSSYVDSRNIFSNRDAHVPSLFELD